MLNVSISKYQAIVHRVNEVQYECNKQCLYLPQCQLNFIKIMMINYISVHAYATLYPLTSRQAVDEEWTRSVWYTDGG